MPKLVSTQPFASLTCWLNRLRGGAFAARVNRLRGGALAARVNRLRGGALAVRLNWLAV